VVPVASALLYALACWGAASWLGAQTPAALGITSRSAAGTAFIDGAWNTTRPLATAHLGAAASYGLAAAVILLLVGILVHLVHLGRTTASDATVITH